MGEQLGVKFSYVADKSKKSPLIHYLPFKIEYEGEANVELFNVREDSTSVLKQSCDVPEHGSGSFGGSSPDSGIDSSSGQKAYFRSRPLNGDFLKLPSNYSGCVVSDLKPNTGADPDSDNESSGNNTNAEDKTLYVMKQFDKMTYWNWDRIPSGMDAPVKLMDWLKLSETLHSPIQPED